MSQYQWRALITRLLCSSNYNNSSNYNIFSVRICYMNFGARTYSCFIFRARERDRETLTLK